MEELFNELTLAGCDIDGTMERFLNDTELFCECLKQTLDDPAFEVLGDALRSGNVKDAFESSHTLKGIIANMGMVPMLDTIVKIVDPLRSEHIEGLMPLYDTLMEQRSKFKNIISRYIA